MSEREISIEEPDEDEEDNQQDDDEEEQQSQPPSQADSNKHLLKSTISKLAEVTDYLQLLVNPTNSLQTSLRFAQPQGASQTPSATNTVTFRAMTNRRNDFRIPKRKYRYQQQPKPLYEPMQLSYFQLNKPRAKQKTIRVSKDYTVQVGGEDMGQKRLQRKMVEVKGNDSLLDEHDRLKRNYKRLLANKTRRERTFFM